MAFLKTILIILLVYYLVKVLARMFAPKILSYAAKKTEAHFKERFEGFTESHTKQEEKVGEVIIDKTRTQKRKESKKVGEYIDFEEID